MSEKKLTMVFEKLQTGLSGDQQMTLRILSAVSTRKTPSIQYNFFRQALSHLLYLALVYFAVSLTCLALSEACSRLIALHDGFNLSLEHAHSHVLDEISDPGYFPSNLALNAFSLLGVVFRGVLPFSLWVLAVVWLIWITVIPNPEEFLPKRKESFV